MKIEGILIIDLQNTMILIIYIKCEYESLIPSTSIVFYNSLINI